MSQKNKNKPPKKNKKLLFILKKKNNYGISNSAPYGLKTSCSLVAKCLEPYHIESKIVEIIDGNCIDREIHHFRPNFVILEAIHCPPYKLKELLKKYYGTTFSVRIHSKFPFLAQERMALEWLSEYNDLANKYKNFIISANSSEFIEQINNVLGYNIIRLSNCYPVDKTKSNKRCVGEILDIGCFGAMRILKNQLFQAVCAIYFADRMEKTLRFHVNDSSTFEREGHSILHNLINLFKNLKHQLIIHPWENHDDFIKMVKKMDLGMQVSFTESYNIVAADMVNQGIPVVGSNEIEFLSSCYQADPNDFEGIYNKLKFAVYNKWLGIHGVNKIKLKNNTESAIKTWLEFLNS